MPARVELIAPDSAEQGKQIKIDAYVTNDLGYQADFWIQVIADEGIRDDLIINTQFPAAHGARAGSFTAYYTMPDHDIILHAYVLYWGFTEEMGWDWYYYDDVSKTVRLAAAPPPAEPEFHGFQVTEYVRR